MYSKPSELLYSFATLKSITVRDVTYLYFIESLVSCFEEAVENLHTKILKRII